MGSPKGVKHDMPQEHRERLRQRCIEWNVNRTYTGQPERRAEHSAKIKSYWADEEWRAKMMEARRNGKKRRISENFKLYNWTGRHKTEEMKIKYRKYAGDKERINKSFNARSMSLISIKEATISDNKKLLDIIKKLPD